MWGNEDSIEAPGFRLTIAPEAGFLRIGTVGQARSVADVAGVTRRVENAAIAGGYCRLLWDFRKSVAGPPEVREALWDWMRRGELPFGAVALLTESVMMVVSVNLDARVHRLTVRAFSEEAPAVDWLVAVEPRPGSWRPPQTRPLSVAPPPRKD